MVTIAQKREVFKTIDWWLISLYFILITIGWVNINSSIQSSEPSSLIDFSLRNGKQFVWILTSLGLGGIILFLINPRLYESLSIPIYAATIFTLIAVIFLGIEVKGSRSWFAFGPVRLQPAEISKIATSLMLATYTSQTSYKMTNIKNFIITALIIIVPMFIIIAQSETGSALVYVGFVFVLYREGLSGWLLFIIGMSIIVFILTLTSSIYVSILFLVSTIVIANCLYVNKFKKFFYLFLPIIILLALIPSGLDMLKAKTANPESFIHDIDPLYVLGGLIISTLPLFIYKAFRRRGYITWVSIGSFIVGLIFTFSVNFIFEKVLQDHQRKRIEVLLGIKDDPMGVGYNVNQSLIAIGSGGLTGKGYLNGTQTTFGFVPEQSTDFIFCTVGEEWGFMGSSVLILLFVALIWRIIYNAEKSRERFTRVYGYSLASCIFMHLMINIGMTIGLMPVIGIPLPFISYGGSSIWAFSVFLFIFIALVKNEKKYF